MLQILFVVAAARGRAYSHEKEAVFFSLERTGTLPPRALGLVFVWLSLSKENSLKRESRESDVSKRFKILIFFNISPGFRVRLCAECPTRADVRLPRARRRLRAVPRVRSHHRLGEQAVRK